MPNAPATMNGVCGVTFQSKPPIADAGVMVKLRSSKDAGERATAYPEECHFAQAVLVEQKAGQVCAASRVAPLLNIAVKFEVLARQFSLRIAQARQINAKASKSLMRERIGQLHIEIATRGARQTA